VVFNNASPPDLFGTTEAGGAFKDGVAFELLPPNSAGNPTFHWSEKVLHPFKGSPTDGASPNGLIIDGNGVLYGTTFDGVAFDILPPSLSTTGAWQEFILHLFKVAAGSVGDRPSGLLLDPATGKLYGTTEFDGRYGNGLGTVYELAPTADPKVWHETVLAYFGGWENGDGAMPQADLNFGADGSLYGTTFAGGRKGNHRYPNGWGTVFQVTPP
jgi:uncharacterized repeat protein (TIGR03803 family)